MEIFWIFGDFFGDWGIFWIFLGFFWRNFFGGFFWEDFLGGFFGRIFWEEFFVYIGKVILNMEGVDLFVKILVFVKILSLREGRTKI